MAITVVVEESDFAVDAMTCVDRKHDALQRKHDASHLHVCQKVVQLRKLCGVYRAVALCVVHPALRKSEQSEAVPIRQQR